MRNTLNTVFFFFLQFLLPASSLLYVCIIFSVIHHFVSLCIFHHLNLTTTISPMIEYNSRSNLAQIQIHSHSYTHIYTFTHTHTHTYIYISSSTSSYCLKYTSPFSPFNVTITAGTNCLILLCAPLTKKRL